MYADRLAIHVLRVVTLSLFNEVTMTFLVNGYSSFPNIPTVKILHFVPNKCRGSEVTVFEF